jgi:NAD(P)-dependent dehydrogenase (short-subunit alcohol dehydrogenase family)
MIQGRVAIVTGSTSGIGLAVARRTLAPHIFETEEEALSQLRSRRMASSSTTSGA